MSEQQGVGAVYCCFSLVLPLTILKMNEKKKITILDEKKNRP